MINQLRHRQANDEIGTAICGGLRDRVCRGELAPLLDRCADALGTIQRAPGGIVTQFNGSGPIVVGAQSATGSLVVLTQLYVVPPFEQRIRRTLAPPGFDSNVLFQLQQRRARSIVEGVFLYDGLLPRDLPRMNPPRELPPDELKQ